MMAVIRSAMYIVIFYTVSVFFVVTAFLAQWFSVPLMQWAVRGWSRWQYSCYRRILGINIKIVGALPQKPVLYAIKHESMFETIDMPRMFHKPAVVTKKELFDIPLWGPAARAYGMIPVDRNGGAGALRAMLVLAKKMMHGSSVVNYQSRKLAMTRDVWKLTCCRTSESMRLRT